MGGEVFDASVGSVFDRKPLEELYADVRRIYKRDRRPWVIGYSGGKDSTTALQIIWYALRDLPADERTKPVYVISSDTLVETPIITGYITTSLERINQASREQRLPFQAHQIVPALQDTFWVNLVGRGYPAPNRNFRWCTERLKIRPANRFILERAAEFGEVVLVLGVRKSESSTRAQVISLHTVQGQELKRHSTLPNAFVYTPIEDFQVGDVWNYLLQVPCPWGNNNRDLVTMYRNAQAGECPLVVDTTTPSCGNSRFGCWVCTVVQRDHSMESLIENGEDWMEPMLRFRDWLSETQDPKNKTKYRTFKRRGGRVTAAREGKGSVPGPYKFEVRQDMLRRVLSTEAEILRLGGPDVGILITDDELREIRRLWRTEEQDWADSVAAILAEHPHRRIEWEKDDVGAFSGDDKVLLDMACGREGIASGLVAKMLDIERHWQGSAKRLGIYKDLERALGEQWLTDEDEQRLGAEYMAIRGLSSVEDEADVEEIQ